MRKQFYRWQLQLNRKNVRERAMIILLMLVVIYVIWEIVFLTPARERIEAIEKQITMLQQQARSYANNSQRIDADAALVDNQNLLRQYQDLQLQLGELNHKIKTYQFHTVSSAQMATMLQAVLKEVPGVTIDELKTISIAPPAKPDKQAANSDPLKSREKHYQLEISGPYFSLQAYLERLNRLDWEIYWDEFSYHVTKRPIGKMVLHFHTLSLGMQHAK